MGIYVRGRDLYPATIRRRGAIYEAQFVDIPHCVAFAPSAYEAEVRAEKTLAAYVNAKRDHGWTIPTPTIVANAPNARDNYVAYIQLPPARMAQPA